MHLSSWHVGDCHLKMQFLQFHDIHKHMAMFLQFKFKIHGLEKNPWGHELWLLPPDFCWLTSGQEALTHCHWPMSNQPWALSPEPWALAMVQELLVLNHNNSTWNLYFLQWKTCKIKQKTYVFNWKSMFFCFSSFAAVFYYKILISNKSLPNKGPPPTPTLPPI